MESVWIITKIVNTINCINFPCKFDDFSFVSITLAAQQPRIETKLSRRNALPVANLQWEKFWYR